MCVLRVWGRSFDPDLALASSGLIAVKIFRAGEARRQSDPGGRKNESSGFTVGVSDAPWDSVGSQVSDALRFLQTHATAIAELRATPGVEDIRLDFPVDLRIDGDAFVMQSETFPMELVRLAGTLGVALEITIYPQDFEATARASVDGS